MGNYQFFLLDRQDGAALAEARKALGAQTMEVWQGERCVAPLLQVQ
jgi:hypothetical protein